MGDLPNVPSYLPTNEMLKAFEYIKSNKVALLILGKAGTGKSTFIKHLTQRYIEGLVLLAPTGIAAINIEGQTIHSFFQFPNENLNIDNVNLDLQPEIFKKIKYLVIDEISMVRADLMDAVDYSLRMYLDSSNVPFGGVKVLLIGDLFQLPPVKKQWDMQTFNKTGYYKSEYFFSSNVIKKLIVSKQIDFVEFKEPLRQREREFIDVLDYIRLGILNNNTRIALNSRVRNFKLIQEIPNLTILTTKKKIAKDYNLGKLGNIPSNQYTFQATIEGEFNEIPESDLPTDKELFLKEGAQIIFVRNSGTWVNGMLGKIKEIEQSQIVVEREGKILYVTKESWEQYKHTLKKGVLVKEKCGEFRQFPVKLGWALTIHKSQGLTLENIFVDIGSGAFTSGQIYVALSRVRSIDNIYLKGNIRDIDLIDNEFVKSFLEIIRLL